MNPSFAPLERPVDPVGARHTSRDLPALRAERVQRRDDLGVAASGPRLLAIGRVEAHRGLIPDPFERAVLPHLHVLSLPKPQIAQAATPLARRSALRPGSAYGIVHLLGYCGRRAPRGDP